MNKNNENKTEPSASALARIAPKHRLLLLPHCLRKIAHCRATYNGNGLQCAHCDSTCAINILTRAAAEAGYGGICVAPGGSMAVRAVQEMAPQGIVAVACPKELQVGIDALADLFNDDDKPVVEIIPLTKDGCVNTEVDIAAAIGVIKANSNLSSAAIISDIGDETCKT